MKGEVTLRILELIGDATVDSVDLIIAFLTAGYGASASKLEYEFKKRSGERLRRQANQLGERRQKRRLDKMLYRLKNDGLVEDKVSDGKSYFKLTLKGRRCFEVLKKRHANALPPNVYSPHSQKSDKFVIVVFDIPERERKKRDWLRSALKNIGFQLIQKSVWMGKVKIPKEFLDDLKELRLVEFVEIFEISKAGSLQQLI